jgi:hypothetical protein
MQDIFGTDRQDSTEQVLPVDRRIVVSRDHEDSAPAR